MVRSGTEQSRSPVVRGALLRADAAVRWDFRYFDAIFKVGKDYYSGVINMQPLAKGMLLKDITQIRNITKDIANSYGENPKFDFLRDASMDSVTDAAQKSTTQNGGKRESRKVDSEGRELTDEDLKERAAEIAQQVGFRVAEGEENGRH